MYSTVYLGCSFTANSWYTLTVPKEQTLEFELSSDMLGISEGRRKAQGLFLFPPATPGMSKGSGMRLERRVARLPRPTTCFFSSGGLFSFPSFKLLTSFSSIFFFQKRGWFYIND